MPSLKTSCSVCLVIGSTRSTTKLKSRVLSQMQQVEDQRHRQEQYNANIAGLSTESQMLLADMQHQAVDSMSAGVDDTMGTINDDFQWETVPSDQCKIQHSSSSTEDITLLRSHVLIARITG
ncbi:hypothetical protein F4604DRAFT_1934354 [Suillus subluteus]|nr:hypothetical protein F4604DRAFT_1934354 [Suillus subluteus]